MDKVNIYVILGIYVLYAIYVILSLIPFKLLISFISFILFISLNKLSQAEFKEFEPRLNCSAQYKPGFGGFKPLLKFFKFGLWFFKPR